MSRPLRFGAPAPLIPLVAVLLLLSLMGGRVSAGPAQEPGLGARPPETESSILGEIERFDRQLQELADQSAELRERHDETEAARRRAELEYLASKTRLDALRQEVRLHCAVLYRLVRRGLARVLFDAESPTDLRRRVRYLVSVLAYDRERIRLYADENTRMQAALTLVEQKQTALARLDAEIVTQQKSTLDQKAARVTFLETLRSRLGLAERAFSEKSRATEDFTTSLKQASTSLSLSPQALEEQTSSRGSSFRSSFGKLPWPVKGKVVRSFGPYTDPLSGQQGRNQGINIEAPYGAPFRCVFDGVVTKAGFLRGYGQTVVVEHAAWTTVYAHANGLTVVPGQEVSRGSILGYVGNSGLIDTTGYQLHFEIRYNATPQDPSPWLLRGALN